jgi:hypothetical protein
MSRRLATFSADDISRAFRGAQNAGAKVARCEIEPGGRIVLVTTDGAALDVLDKSGAKSRLSALARWQAEEDAS